MNANCRTRGFALLVPLVLVALGLSAVLGVASLMCLNLRSASAFSQILARQQLSGATAPTECLRLGAPEGWDHEHFASLIETRHYGEVAVAAWQVGLRQQPCLSGPEPVCEKLALVLDTSTGMLEACGLPFIDEAVYLRRADGVITGCAYELGQAAMLETPDGTYLRGSLANSLYPQGMSWWTALSSRLQELEPAAGWLVTDGGTERSLEEALAAWQVQDCALAARLAAALDAFETDGTAVVVTRAAELKHGDLDLPDCKRQPCDCLELVAQRAQQRGITVHVLGPEVELLSRTAVKGGGQLNPASLAAGPDFVNVLAELNARTYAPFNRAGQFSLSGFELGATRYYGQDFEPVAAFAARGATCAALGAAGRLYVSTWQDQLACLQPQAGACDWLAEGLGGPLRLSGAVLLCGPDKAGYVTALGLSPSLRWRYRAEHCSSSDVWAYLAQAGRIRAVDLLDGRNLGFVYEAGAPVTALAYDAALREVWVGLRGGAVVGLDAQLKYRSGFTACATVRRLLNFSWRRQVYTVVLTDAAVAVYAAGQQVWSRPLVNETVTAAWVADRRLNLLMYRTSANSGALQQGASRLLEIEALSGADLAERDLGAGRWAGPLIDLAAGRLQLVSWRGELLALELGELVSRGRLGRCLQAD